MSGFMKKVQLVIDEIPQNLDAEKCVIASIIRDPDLFYRENMPSDFFFDQTNRGVYAAICDIAARGDRIVASTIKQRFDTSKFSNAGLNELMRDLSRIATDPASFKVHAKALKDAYIKRQIHIAGSRMRELSHRSDEGSSLTQMAADLISNIKIEEKSDDCAEGLEDLFAEMNEEFIEGKLPASIMPTGLPRLDDLLKGGFQKEDYIIIGAGSSVGKTQIGLQLAWQQGLVGKHVFFFSAESGRRSIMDRSISLLGQVDAGDIRRRSQYIDMDGVLKAQHIIKTHVGKNVFFEYTPQISVQNLKAKLSQHIAKHGVPDIVFVDYLQYLKQDVRCNTNSLVDVVRQTTKDLKDITRTYKLCLAALAQINTEGCKEEEGPQVYHIAECPSQIRQDADIIMLLHITEKLTAMRHRIKLRVAKGRDIGEGEMYLEALRNYMRFIEDNGAPVKPLKSKDLTNEELVRAIMEEKEKLPKRKQQEVVDNEAHPFDK